MKSLLVSGLSLAFAATAPVDTEQPNTDTNNAYRFGSDRNTERTYGYGRSSQPNSIEELTNGSAKGLISVHNAAEYGRFLGIKEEILQKTNASQKSVYLVEHHSGTAAYYYAYGRHDYIVIDIDDAQRHPSGLRNTFIHELAHHKYGENCDHTMYTEELLFLQYGRFTPDYGANCGGALNHYAQRERGRYDRRY